MNVAERVAAFQEKTEVTKRTLRQQPQSDFNGVAVMLMPRRADQKIISEWAKVKEDDLHCTMMMVGDDAILLNETGTTLDKLKAILSKVVNKSNTINATLGGVTRFNGKDQDPIVLNVNSKEVDEFRALVVTALEDEGIKNSSDYGFTPHLTIGYVRKHGANPVKKWDTLDIIFDRVRIGYGGKNVDLPLFDPVVASGEPTTLSDKDVFGGMVPGALAGGLRLSGDKRAKKRARSLLVANRPRGWKAETKAVPLRCKNCGKTYFTDDMENPSHKGCAEKSISERVMELKAVRDGDGDGFIFDGTARMRPTPVGTPIIGKLTYGGKSPDWAGLDTAVDSHGDKYHYGKEGGEWYAIGEHGSHDDPWDDIVVQNASTRGEMLRMLDARTRTKRPAGTYRPIDGTLSDRPTRIRLPRDQDELLAQRQQATAKKAVKKSAKKTAKKTAKRGSGRPRRDPEAFGRSGTEFQVAGQNEEGYVVGDELPIAKRRRNDGKPGARRLIKVRAGSKTERYLREKYGIPPAYTDIHWNMSREERDSDDDYDGLVYSAMAANGKRQPVYTVRHRNIRNQAKSGDVAALAKNYNKIMGQLRKDAEGAEPRRRAAAQALLVQALTGLRIGDDNIAEEGVFGASTLQAQHVTVNAASVRFQFAAKGRTPVTDEDGKRVMGADGKPLFSRGSAYDVTIRSVELAEMMRKVKEGKRGSARLFDKADHNGYLKSLMSQLGIKGANITTHNFRHHYATARAEALIKKTAVPRSEAQFKSKQKEIVKAVASMINDTEKITFSSYIQPSVWDQWNNGGEWKGM